MKNIAILGSTGSIGRQTLEIADENPDIKVIAISAGKNVDLLEKQIRKYHPDYAVIWSEDDAWELEKRVKELKTEILCGMEGLLQISTLPDVDVVVTAVVGMIGIRPTIAAIKAGKDIALANKETLVTAGHIIMPLAKENNVSILPVDSEHSAIFQSLHCGERKELKKIWLTASGGPFRGRKREELADIRIEDALKHPNWAMGRKITIDSATMVNKGLEVMEAKWLFQVDTDHIEVVVHPQSIIHSMVEFVDGAVIGQMGLPDMRLPIQYALFYPERRNMSGKRLDFFELGTMTFEKPDLTNFPGLSLAIKAANVGGSMPTVLNAANEKAVAMFLNQKIGYLQITDLIEKCMNHHQVIGNPDIDEILETEQETYKYIESL